MNKRTSKRNRFFTLKRVLVAALILMVASGALAAYAEVHRAAQLASSTMQSLKQQCISFNRLVAADRTKSLYRLSDMMLDLSEDLKRDPSLATDDYLEAYVDNLRLSGVALLNYAYETMFQAFALTKEQDRVIHALRVVSQKTGIHGMLGGQSVDVENDGKPLEKEMLDYIYRNKTSALIEASMMTGAILAGANEQEVSAVEKAAGNIGLAFQIQDDILDVTSTAEELGKPVHSDAKNNKVTYVTLFGTEKAAEQVEELSEKAIDLLKSLNKNNEFLYLLIEKLINRRK